jgi:hypothetical protein
MVAAILLAVAVMLLAAAPLGTAVMIVAEKLKCEQHERPFLE